MIDGTRTRDNRNHNPGLYQLSYDHRLISGGREGYAMNLDLEREKSHLSEIIRNFQSSKQSTPPKKGGGFSAGMSLAACQNINSDC